MIAFNANAKAEGTSLALFQAPTSQNKPMAVSALWPAPSLQVLRNCVSCSCQEWNMGHAHSPVTAVHPSPRDLVLEQIAQRGSRVSILRGLQKVTLTGSRATFIRRPWYSTGVDYMIFGGPFQPQPLCDSVSL